ncbi:MAG: hypothetical protein NTW87_03715 [Planctomycetota bacterium]|nr:hypothetical protein [Planctomycetota bacterium]
MLLVDDSVTIELGTATVGEYRGPDFLLLLPVGVTLSSRAFVAIARARTATIRLIAGTYTLTVPIREPDRRDIAALFLVTVCGGT